VAQEVGNLFERDVGEFTACVVRIGGRNKIKRGGLERWLADPFSSPRPQ
jgi:hypothetical protein